MFCNSKQLDVKHAPDLPIAQITVTICQDSTTDTSNMQHTKYFYFEYIFFKEISKLQAKTRVVH